MYRVPNSLIFPTQDISSNFELMWACVDSVNELFDIKTIKSERFIKKNPIPTLEEFDNYLRAVCLVYVSYVFTL